MIYTTYFANLKHLPPNVIPIAISAKVPDWYTGLRYSKLAPKYYNSVLMRWRYSSADYAEYFNQNILNNLNITKVLDELQVMLPEDIKMQMQGPFWRNEDWHVVLICYEKPDDICHRHLVSQWLRDNGYDCNELLGVKEES